MVGGLHMFSPEAIELHVAGMGLVADDRGYKGVVLGERTGEHHAKLRILNDRILLAARTGDSLMFGRFTQGRVVVGRGRTPDVGDDRSLGLVDIAASVLTCERLIENRIGGIARDDQRRGGMNEPDQVEGEVGDTFSASGGADDEELEVRIVALGRDAVTAVEIRHTTACSRQEREEEHVLLSRRLRELEKRLNHRRQGFGFEV